jgi:hypothetical protein
MAHFKVLSWHSLGRAEENHEKPQSIYLPSQQDSMKVR